MKQGGQSRWNYGLVRKGVETGGLLSYIRRFWNHVEACELIEEKHMVLICKHLEACAISGTRSLKPDLKKFAWAQPTDLCEWEMDPSDPTGLTHNLTPGVPEMIQDLVIAIPPGMSQPHSEPVLLERGWVPMGEVVVGDRIYGTDGRLQDVLAVHPQGEREVWEVEFSNGEVVRCDAEHLWTFRNREGTVRTKTLREWSSRPLKVDNGGFQAHTLFCPLPAAIERPDAALPLDAYTLGVLLGDGHLGRSTNFTSADPQLMDALVLPEGMQVKLYRKAGTEAVQGSLTGTEHRGQHRYNPLHEVLRALGLFGTNSFTKFIPREYLMGSAAQRLALLQGLMDTDGTAQHTAGTYTSRSLELAQGVRELAESLGGTASWSVRQVVGLPHYGVYVRLPGGVCPFRLDRKAKKYNSGRGQRPPNRAVVEIRPAVGVELCSCISVSNPDSLYVTKHHVLTHNSKSKIVSVFFPAWVWTWCPGAKFITTSYADDLAIDFGRQSFDLMRSEDHRACWPELDLEDGERAAMSDYRNSAGGRRWSMPMGGKVTGKHGHFLLSDDPVKPDDLKLGGDSAREALNQVKYRWDNLFSNRSAHAATFTRIVIAQRLHHEDLSGHYVRQGAVHLRLPMLYEPHESYDSVWGSDWRGDEGELLAPLRFPAEVIKARLKITAARDWAAQYQQRPSPEDGSNFKAEWFKNRYEGMPWGTARLTISVDASNKKEGKNRAKSDYTVLTLWARVGPDAYLIDCVRARMGFKDQLIAITAMRRRWANVGSILIEDKANGPAIIDVLKSKFPGVIALDPQGGKEARAAATEWVWDGGNIYLPAKAPWLQDFIDEHLLFPVGSNDDMVDSTSQFINWSFSRDRKQLFKKAMAAQRQKMLAKPRWA